MLPEAARYKKEWQKRQRSLIKSDAQRAYLYVHLEADSGEPFYVGIGETVGRPWSKKRSRKHVNRANKYGNRVELIEVPEINWDIACFWEQRWIKALRDAGYDLVNLTDGGEGMSGFKFSPEVCEFRSKFNPMKRPEIASKIAGPNHFTKKIPGYKTIFETDKNPGYSEKNLIRMRGPENPMKNSETVKNNSQKRLGQKRTPEQIKNIKKGQQAHQDSITDEEREISTAKQIETKIKNGTLVTVRTKEENIAAGRKSWKTRRERGTDKYGKQDISPEKATARAQKGWETRKKKGNVKSTRSEAERKATGQKIWVTRRLNQLRAEQYWGA